MEKEQKQNAPAVSEREQNPKIELEAILSIKRISMLDAIRDTLLRETKSCWNDTSIMEPYLEIEKDIMEAVFSEAKYLTAMKENL